jgi:Zn-dependent protease
MIGTDLTVQLLVLRLIAGLIIATVQGAVIAGMAVLLGDQGPRYDGRLTLLPWGHVDVLGLGSLMLTGFGWGRPVAIDPDKLRLGRWGLVLAVLAQSAALLLAGVVLLLLAIPLLRVLDFTAGVTAAAFVREAARLCVWMALLSLLPIPPLAGSHFLAALGLRVPKQAGIYLGWALFAASVFGVTRIVLAPAYYLIAPMLLGIDVAGY